MIRRLVSPLLLAAFVLAPQGATARPDDHRQERREERRDDKEDRRAWKEHDQREKQYWKEQRREAREHQAHRYFEDEQRHDQGRRPIPPPWMNGYWRAGESRRYVALVPGDPSRMYVFIEGRWLLRQVRDPRARLDLDGAFRLPMAAPPVPPPHLGLNLHVVLFN